MGGDSYLSGSSNSRPPSSPTFTDAQDAEGEPWFEEVGDAWGLDFVHDAGATPEKHLPETMGGGAAIVDVDRDGDLDLYFVQSGPMPVGEAATKRATAPPNRLFLREPAGFVDRTATCGAAAHRGYGMGVAVGDVDGDGLPDFYLTALGPDALLRNEGGARFSDRTAAAGLGDPRWTTGATFFDPDADGDLDLYVLGYVEVDLDDPPWCGRREPGWRSYCHPDRFPGLADRFWRNDGRGRFEDATRAAGLADNLGKGLGVAAFDFDDDGALDLYVANDSVENRLWRGLGDGRFEDATLLSATGVNHHGATEAGMGVATGDVDGDGLVDLFVTNFDEESNTLYRNDGDGLFSDRTSRSGLDAPSRWPVGFGTVLADFDADGDLDLAVTNGHIVDNIELYNDGKAHAQPSQLFENLGAGRFRERVTSVLRVPPVVGRGLYQGDLDGDGWIDLVLTQCGGPVRVLRNRLGERGGPTEADGDPSFGAPSPAAPSPGVALGGAAPSSSAGGSRRGDLVAGRPPGVVVVDAPSGTRFRARFAGGLELVRDAGAQNSYLGASSPDVMLFAGGRALVALSARRPGTELGVVELPADAVEPGRYRLRVEGRRLLLEPAQR